MSNVRYSLSEKEILNLNFELIYISKSKFENDWHSTLHSHPFTEIFFITNGSGLFQVDNNEFSVKESDLIIINPNSSHTEKPSKINCDFEYIVFGINNLILSDNIDKTEGYKNINLKSKKNYLIFLLNTIIRELEEKNKSYELICKSIITLLLIDILRDSESSVFLPNSSSKINSQCLKIKNYIDSHYSENITLDVLANLGYMNKFHLVHTFTKEFGISPINYLINKRIDESKNLLHTTNYSVRDISSIVGFSNSSYFSQMFKKITKVSPKDFRSSYA